VTAGAATRATPAVGGGLLVGQLCFGDRRGGELIFRDDRFQRLEDPVDRDPLGGNLVRTSIANFAVRVDHICRWNGQLPRIGVVLPSYVELVPGPVGFLGFGVDGEHQGESVGEFVVFVDEKFVGHPDFFTEVDRMLGFLW
jgi:hypothetical protein